ncbi:TonB-dependent receptor [hydrothermal vent metagenome]|uniref:TonB-dependent receptor n=1 Tax=hydrothermal vent metagenome TaxID=652676 RepID=A0A3B0S5A5_9ZZZZ
MSAIGKKTFYALLSTTALSMISPALAAEDDAAKDDAIIIDEIMVTATRRSTTIQDVPYNISAVSGLQIENSKMLDAAELLRSIPGVAITDRGPRNAGVINNIRIRGLNVDSSLNGDVAVLSAPTVATYINETPIFANVMLKDLERVEVLRGPQGTLYGSGALGGAVRYITAKPKLDEFSVWVQGSASNTDGSDGVSLLGDITVNIPISENIAFRAVGSRADYAGLTDYVSLYKLDNTGTPVAPNGILSPDATFETKKDADTYKSWFFRGTLLANLGEDADATITYTRQSDRTGGRRASAEGFQDGFGNTYGKYEAGSIQLEPSQADVEMAALEVNVDMGFATLTSSTSYYDHQGSSTSENTGFYAQVGWLSAFYYNYARPMAVANRGYQDKGFVQEVRLASDNEGPFNYVAGVYYQDQDKRSTQQSFLRGFKEYVNELFGFSSFLNPSNQDFDYNGLTNAKELAFFGEITYDLSDDVHFTGGVRQFNSDVTSDVRMELPLFIGFAAPVSSTDKQDESGTLFKGNISWDFSEDDKVYATFSQGYRRGGTNAVPLSGNFAEDPGWLTYGSDRVDSYEIGIKGSHENIRYVASFFYMDWKDAQLNTSTTNWGFFAVQNGGQARTKGFELELDGQLSESLHYNFGYAYVDAKLNEDLLAPTAAATLVAPKGSVLPGVPEHMLNLNLDYTAQLTADMDLILRVNGYYQSSTENSINASSGFFGQTIDGFSIWNTSATVMFDTVNVTFWIKNLFNSDGITGVYKESYMGTRPSANYFGSGAKNVIALPRTVGISASYSF